MGKINWARVVLGGIVAGVVASVLTGALWLLGSARWVPVVQPHVAVIGPGQSIPSTGFLVISGVAGIVLSIIMTWLYAAIRPRYGPGPKTAAIAGFALYLFAVGSDAIWIPMTAFPTQAAVEMIVGCLPIFIISAIAGAAIYNEPAQAAAARTSGWQRSVDCARLLIG
jgi:hypothetical protein